MGTIIDSILDDVQNDDEIRDVKLTIDELCALDKVAYIVSRQLYEYREQIEKAGGEIELKKSLFIDSLISASNVLNNMF